MEKSVSCTIVINSYSPVTLCIYFICLVYQLVLTQLKL